jgi:hypothetical protein
MEANFNLKDMDILFSIKTKKTSLVVLEKLLPSRILGKNADSHG